MLITCHLRCYNRQHFSDIFDHIVGGIVALLNFKSMTTLMHSKGSKFHLTLNTFMSTAEHVRNLKVVSVLYSLEVKPSFLIKV